VQDQTVERDVDGSRTRLAEAQAELERVTAAHTAQVAAAADARAASVEVARARDAVAAEFDLRQRGAAEAARAATGEAQTLADLAQEESQLDAKLAELDRRCRDLGALPGDALDRCAPALLRRSIRERAASAALPDSTA